MSHTTRIVKQITEPTCRQDILSTFVPYLLRGHSMIKQIAEWYHARTLLPFWSPAIFIFAEFAALMPKSFRVRNFVHFY